VWRVRVDRGVALVGGVVVTPLVAALAVLVLLADRQAPFVGLPRVGRHGRPFTLWKLRTMRHQPGAAATFTVRDDERITALGHRLRRWRLDELPQLWNVVRGDMALIGPRPEAPEFVDDVDGPWAAVLTVPPGIAGATQVVVHAWEAQVTSLATYRDEVLPRKLEVDAWYVDHATPRVDLDVARSILRSVAQPDRPTAVHRRLADELPATLAAIDEGGRPR
jgi:lipopolysaccharide/colanic/teichoic acid biosynthesis glycosyltransferase